ncbi:MAG: DUF2961 domain-containing protein [Planctomycetes bacterium]|nr:DUF2961 domain-containing protein [Planctomycetota bacterium]
MKVQIAGLIVVLLLASQCMGQVSVEAESAGVLAEKVTLESLLWEMVDRGNPARVMNPGYECLQFSSYDRDSVGKGEPGWFANWDRSQFIREEENEGRREFVLMDAAGPGAVVRFWATWHGFSGKPFYNGMLRVYLDGEAKPAIEGKIADVISGGQLVGPPLSQSVSPQAEERRRAHNLYFPIPYARRCKITYESPEIVDAGARKGEALYYQINYRRYERGTEVESYSAAAMPAVQPMIKRVQEMLTRGERKLLWDETAKEMAGKLPVDGSRSVRLSGPGAIRELMFKLEAADIEQALRSTVLEIEFDRKRTVWCPVGDFMGTGHKLNPYRTWYTKVDRDGTMRCFWVMPFEESATVTVRNLGRQEVDLQTAKVNFSGWEWDEDSLYFHATWRNYQELATGEDKVMDDTEKSFDMNYVEIEGEGNFVGDVLTIMNGINAWWGEGDEKIYVDGEKFPSHFGTGTEDYYGYAWCRPEFFEAPFHAQPNGDGNLVGGYSVNVRFRALDVIPFEKSLKFDMELWHWKKTRVNFAPATMWYGRGAARCNVAPAEAEARRAVTRKPWDVKPPRKVEGALEGELLEVKEVTGGGVRVQNVARFNWSNDRQVWWVDGGVGDRLVLEFEAQQAGRVRVAAGLTKASDYGVVKIGVNGATVIEQLDLYNPQVTGEEIVLGWCEVKQGANRLEVTIVGANKAALKRYMFGLDYLLLKENLFK